MSSSDPVVNLHADFAQRVVVDSDALAWRDSPMPGVTRRMLDRIGDEVARATSIVRYAPNSHFSPHVHTGGEEFVVLDGVFQDEHGDYPAGTYVRNPPQSRHTPGSSAGCILFVKLWQFDLSDRTGIVAQMDDHQAQPVADRPGVRALRLHHDQRETVCLEVWAPEASVSLDAPGGLEVLVLDGTFTDRADTLAQNAWLRVPVGGSLRARAGPNGARVWLKTGGLRFVDAPILPTSR